MEALFSTKNKWWKSPKQTKNTRCLPDILRCLSDISTCLSDILFDGLLRCVSDTWTCLSDILTCRSDTWRCLADISPEKACPVSQTFYLKKKQHYSQLFSGTLPLTCLPDILTCLSDILQVPWLFRSGGNIFSTKNKWWKETKTKRDIVLSFFSKMFRETAQTAQTAQYVWIDFQYLSKMSGKTS